MRHFYTILKRFKTCPFNFSEIGYYRHTRCPVPIPSPYQTTGPNWLKFFIVLSLWWFYTDKSRSFFYTLLYRVGATWSFIHQEVITFNVHRREREICFEKFAPSHPRKLTKLYSSMMYGVGRKELPLRVKLMDTIIWEASLLTIYSDRIKNRCTRTCSLDQFF